MRDTFSDEVLLALGRIAGEAGAAQGAEDALWCVTRALPGPLGDPDAALRPGAFREPVPPEIGVAAVGFMRMPDARHHLIVAPVNFPVEQRHELVDIRLGHPGTVARSRRPLLLRDTALHQGFVKILQTFRAGSAMFAPMLWQGDYLGVLICASAARCTFGERDLAAFQAFGSVAAACWVAQGGPSWLAALDTRSLPVRDSGT
jgi:hypothetical protein